MKGVHITLRMRLECRIVRRGATIGSHEEAGEVHEVMNEVVVDRGANPYLAKIECWERDTLITKAGALLLTCQDVSAAQRFGEGGCTCRSEVREVQHFTAD